MATDVHDNVLSLGRFSRHAEDSYSLPAAWYTDPAIAEIEKQRIFYRTWQYGTHASDLPSPGSYAVVDLAEQSVLLVRGEDGKVRGFHNVCRHRAHPVAEGSGCKRVFVCPYHAWRYALDGTLKHARNSENVKAFDPAEFGLRPVRVEQFLGLVLFNLDPYAGSFAAQVPGLEQEIRAQVPQIDALTERERVSGFSNDTLACNWKVLVENCAECYHCTPSHPAFADLVDIDSYEVALHQCHSSHRARCREPENDAYCYSTDDRAVFAFWHVWPNLTLGTFPGPPNFNVFSVVPVNATQTQSGGARLRIPGPESEREVLRRRYIDEVLWPEDKSICESVQRGLASIGYGDGRYMVPTPALGQSEAVCHLFAKLNLQAMGVLDD